jgi:hypothetical protein
MVLVDFDPCNPAGSFETSLMKCQIRRRHNLQGSSFEENIRQSVVPNMCS